MAVFKWTQRYYATRKGNEWRRVSGKIGSPLEAMLSTFGHDIEKDVIYLLALAPTPVDCGGERFGATYEIADLGKNKHKADENFARLEAQARAEMRLQKLLSRDLDSELREFLKGEVQQGEHARKNVNMHSSFDSWLAHGVEDLVRCETEAEMAADILARVKLDEEAQARKEAEEAKKAEHEKAVATAVAAGLPPPSLQPPEKEDRIYRPRRRRWQKPPPPPPKPLKPDDRSFLHRRLDEKVKATEELILAGTATSNNYDEYGFKRAFQVCSWRMRARYLATLREKLAEFDDRRAGLAEMDRRFALRRKPVDQILGLEQPSAQVQQRA